MRRHDIRAGLSVIGVAVVLGAAATSAPAATKLPCVSPGKVLQSTASTVLTVNGPRKRIGGRTARPGYYVCAKGHPWRLVAEHDPASYNETLRAQLTDRYVGLSLDSGDSHATFGIYVKTVAIASGASVSFKPTDLPAGASPVPGYASLVFGPVALSADGTVYCVAQFTFGDELANGAMVLLRLDRRGTHTILDQGDIDPWSLALADDRGSTPGHLYWTKAGAVQSAVIPGLPADARSSKR